MDTKYTAHSPEKAHIVILVICFRVPKLKEEIQEAFEAGARERKRADELQGKRDDVVAKTELVRIMVYKRQQLLMDMILFVQFSGEEFMDATGFRFADLGCDGRES